MSMQFITIQTQVSPKLKRRFEQYWRAKEHRTEAEALRVLIISTLDGWEGQKEGQG